MIEFITLLSLLFLGMLINMTIQYNSLRKRHKALKATLNRVVSERDAAVWQLSDIERIAAFPVNVVCPSDVERSEWPDATRDYVEALEASRLQ